MYFKYEKSSLTHAEIGARDYALINRFKRGKDDLAYQTLENLYLPLIISTVNKKSRLTFSVAKEDLQEPAQVGFWIAATKFNPARGPLSNLAKRYMMNEMDAYILLMQSNIPLKNSASVKKAFFQQRKISALLDDPKNGETYEQRLAYAGEELGINPKMMGNMQHILTTKFIAIDTVIGSNNDDRTYGDVIADPSSNPEELLLEHDELSARQAFLRAAMDTLDERERYILEQRKLSDIPATLDILGAEFNVSKERIRQIEVRAFEKVQEHVQKQAMSVQRALTPTSP